MIIGIFKLALGASMGDQLLRAGILRGDALGNQDC